MKSKEYKNLIVFGVIIITIFGIFLYTMNRIKSTKSLKQKYSKASSTTKDTTTKNNTQKGEAYVPGSSKNENKEIFTGSNDTVIKGNTICLASISNNALCQKYDTKNEQYSLNLIEYDFVNETSLDIDFGRYAKTQDSLNSVKKIKQAVYLSDNEILADVSNDVSQWIIKYDKKNNAYSSNQINSSEEIKWSSDNSYAVVKVGLKKVQLINNQAMSGFDIEFNNADIINYGWINENQIYVNVGNQYIRQLFIINRDNTYTSKIADLDKDMNIISVIKRNSDYILLASDGLHISNGGKLSKLTDKKYTEMKAYNGVLYLYGQDLARLNSDNRIEELVSDKQISDISIYNEKTNELVYTSGEKAYLLINGKSEGICQIKNANPNNINFIDDTLIMNAKDDDGLEPLILNVTNSSINNIY